MSSAGNVFVTASELRNNARAYLIIHNEVRSIENAVLLAADNGLLDAIIYNTYMTHVTLDDWKDVDVVNIINDELEVSNHDFLSGDEIQFTTDDTLPSPLVASESYYVLRQDSNTFKVCNSFLDTINETVIDITDVGLGNHQVRKLTPAQQYYEVWKGTRKDRALQDHMNGVIKHFTDLGYDIKRRTDPNTDVTFRWEVHW